MADSSSESEASFDISTIPEDNRDHIREVLAKGKQITPFYSESVLYRIYKRYYQADNVFYNELNIIANRKKEQKEQDSGQGWISVGNTKNQTKKAKYDFLKDKTLIWRANNWDKEEAKHAPHRRRDGGDRRQNNPEGFYKNQKGPYQKPVTNYAEKKSQETKPLKFKEKQTSNESPSPVHKHQSTKQESTSQKKYAEKTLAKETSQVNEGSKPEKKQVQAEAPIKKETPVPKQVVAEQKQVAPQKEVPAEKPAKQDKKVVAPPAEKPAKQDKKFAEKVVAPKEETKKAPKKYKAKEPTESKPADTKKEAPKASQVKNVQKKEEPKESEPVATNLSRSDIDRNFALSIQQYPKILKFIKPDTKIQKVTYTWNNGVIDNVRVHVPLNQ